MIVYKFKYRLDIYTDCRLFGQIVCLRGEGREALHLADTLFEALTIGSVVVLLQQTMRKGKISLLKFPIPSRTLCGLTFHN